MRLVEVRKDIWLASIKDDEGEWEGVEADLPEQADVMMVFLYDDVAKVARAIFTRENSPTTTTLTEICCGLSEIDVELFRNYFSRKIHTPYLNVIVGPETRVGNMVPRTLTFGNPSPDVTSGETTIRITTPRLEDALEMLARTNERGMKQDVYVINETGLPVGPVMAFFDSETCCLLESKTFTFTGA